MKSNDMMDIDLRRGSITLKSAIVMCCFLGIFLASYKLIMNIDYKNELFRREKTLSLNKLMTYDKYIFDKFGLLVYFNPSFTELAAKQFEERKFTGVTHKVMDQETLFEKGSFDEQIRAVVISRISLDFLKNKAIDGISLKDMEKSGEGAKKSSDDLDEMKRTPTVSRGRTSKEAGTGSPVDKLILVEYCMGVFTDRVVSKARETEMFDYKSRPEYLGNGQIESLITGTFDEDAAQSKVYWRILAIRCGIHAVEIRKDAVLMAKFTAAAVVIAAASEGAVPVDAAKAGMVGALALKRAKGDMDILLRGDFVYFSGNMLSKSGMKTYYDDYLRGLLVITAGAELKTRLSKVIGGCYNLDLGNEVELEKGMVGHTLGAFRIDREILRVRDSYVE